MPKGDENSTESWLQISLSIHNSGDIKAGLSAHALIDLNTNEGGIVPTSAVVQNKGHNYVIVINLHYRNVYGW